MRASDSARSATAARHPRRLVRQQGSDRRPFAPSPAGSEAGGALDFEAMRLKAVVKKGRLVVDEPTNLPEGTELVLAVADEDDAMDEAERARLHESLRRSLAQAKAGQVVDSDEVMSKLLARS